MLERYILEGDYANINNYFTKVISESKYLIETDFNRKTIGRINSSLQKIVRKLKILICIYYPNIDMYAVFCESTDKCKYISQTSMEDARTSVLNKISLLLNWSLELTRLKPNPIGIYLLELYVLYINRFITEVEDNIPDITHDSNTKRYTKVYAHMDSVREFQVRLHSLNKFFDYNIKDNIKLSDVLEKIVKIYMIHRKDCTKMFLNITQMLTINLENLSASSTSSIYTRVQKTVHDFKDFRLLYLLVGQLVIDQTRENFNIARVIFGKNREAINITTHQFGFNYVSEIFMKTEEIFIKTLRENHIMRYNLLEKYVQTEYVKRVSSYTDSSQYDKYEINYPKTYEKLLNDLTFTRDIITRYLSECIRTQHIRCERLLYSAGDVLKFSEFQRVFSKLYSSYIPYVLNGKMYQTKGYIGVYFNKRDLSKRKIKQLRTFIGPFQRNNHLQDYVLTCKLKKKLKMFVPDMFQKRILTGDVRTMHINKTIEVLTDARKNECALERNSKHKSVSSADVSESNYDNTDDTQTYNIYTFQMNELPIIPSALEQYLMCKLPNVEQFNLNTIDSLTDDAFKLLIKQLLFKRIVFNKPLVLFKGVSSEILFIRDGSKTINVLSLNDIIYTTSLTEYSIESVSDIKHVYINVNTDPMQASIDSALCILSHILFPCIQQPSVVKLFIQNIIRYRKSYMQFLSILTKLLQKLPCEPSIVLTLVSRIESFNKLFALIK